MEDMLHGRTTERGASLGVREITIGHTISFCGKITSYFKVNIKSDTFLTKDRREIQIPSGECRNNTTVIARWRCTLAFQILRMYLIKGCHLLFVLRGENSVDISDDFLTDMRISSNCLV